MATPAQIQANRLNAQNSTGPRSVEGKAAVRFNALKHGADAESLVIPGEDPAALLELTRAYYEQFQPVGPIEDLLLETIVRCDWNIRRLARLDAQVLNALIDKQEPNDCSLGLAFQQDAAGPNALQKIFRRQQAAQRDWYRAQAELRRLQEQRPPAAPDSLPEPIPAPPAGPQPTPVAVAPTPASVVVSIPAKGGNRLCSEPLDPPAWRL